ncbi:MAG TPA: hypothetical protein VFM08_01055 [Nocardioides sp.]|nr:hypothetical protein [Nocardioides sp.]
MNEPAASLPFVDEHARSVPAPVDRTWRAVEEYAERMSSAPRPVLSRLLGTAPSSGFEVVKRDPPHEVVLAGRHRFSTYRLVFRVEPDGAGSRLRAITYAAFPGRRGRAYVTMLTVSTAHRRATERMLRRVALRAEG